MERLMQVYGASRSQELVAWMRAAPQPVKDVGTGLLLMAVVSMLALIGFAAVFAVIAIIMAILGGG
jgi:hypothetical protein